MVMFPNQVSAMVPVGIESKICDLFETQCFDAIFDDSHYRAENCTDCYPGCKSTILESKLFNGILTFLNGQ